MPTQAFAASQLPGRHVGDERRRSEPVAWTVPSLPYDTDTEGEQTQACFALLDVLRLEFMETVCLVTACRRSGWTMWSRRIASGASNDILIF
jgi:hypothetical protein